MKFDDARYCSDKKEASVSLNDSHHDYGDEEHPTEDHVENRASGAIGAERVVRVDAHDRQNIEIDELEGWSAEVLSMPSRSSSLRHRYDTVGDSAHHQSGGTKKDYPKRQEHDCFYNMPEGAGCVSVVHSRSFT